MSVLLLMYIYTACYQVTDSFPLHSEVMNIRQRFNVSYRNVTIMANHSLFIKTNF